jgi:phosphotransferase system enzyme I (PtsP)
MALIGLGFRDLSMPPPAVGPVKDMVRSLDLAALGAFLGTHLDRAGPSPRQSLGEFAREHGVAI